jgi:hypothetical protein
MFDYVLPGGLSQKCTDTELSLALFTQGYVV